MNELLNRLKAHDDAEQGQIILLLAFAMIGLLVAMGLSIDAGFLYARKTQLDRAIEAAALAGVVRLDDPDVKGEDYDSRLSSANVRGMQLLAANRVLVDSTPGIDCDSVDWTTDDYCGKTMAGSVPGSVRYHAEARWEVPTFFMGIMGFAEIPLQSASTAEYMPMVDIFASDTNQYGMLGLANQSMWGRNICTSRGDAYSPLHGNAEKVTDTNDQYGEINGVYTYRVVVPAGYFDKYPSGVRIELYDPDGGNVPDAWMSTTGYRRNGTPFTATCPYGRGEGCTVKTGDSEIPYWFQRMDETEGSSTSCGGTNNNQNYNNSLVFRLFYYSQETDGSLQEVDLAFYLGKLWVSTTDPTNPSGNHPTHYPNSSYTLNNNSASDLYAEARATDMMWVAPGIADADDRMPAFAAGTIPDGGGGTIAGLSSPAEPYVMTEDCETFRSYHYTADVVDASNHEYTAALACSSATNGDFLISEDELVDAYQTSPGVYEFFIQVSSAWGTGENDFDIWAGPSPRDKTEVAAPAYGNARQIYITNELADDNDEVHYADGVAVYAIGHMPMNMIADDAEDMPLAYLGAETTGQQMTVQLWDADTGTEPPIYFYFDSVPLSDWNACFGTVAQCEAQLNAAGVDDDDVNVVSTASQIPLSNAWSTWSFTIPSIEEEPYVNFPGGRLIANYNGGHTDNLTWNISLESRPFLVE
ncbi:MAG: hypothetical protein JXJ17_15365 [Anaerolineae bacterium]|nr:hypothetical protein [Anaerolineae bacterium]